MIKKRNPSLTTHSSGTDISFLTFLADAIARNPERSLNFAVNSYEDSIPEELLSFLKEGLTSKTDREGSWYVHLKEMADHHKTEDSTLGEFSRAMRWALQNQLARESRRGGIREAEDQKILNELSSPEVVGSWR